MSAFYLITLFNRLFLLYLNVHKKQAFRCWWPNVCLKFPCDAKLITLLFIFLIFLVIIWNECSISISIHPGIIYFWIWLFGGATYQEGEEEEVDSGALMSNLCLISYRWYDVEKLAVRDSSNLNLSFSRAQQKLLFKKNVLHFILLN